MAVHNLLKNRLSHTLPYLILFFVILVSAIQGSGFLQKLWYLDMPFVIMYYILLSNPKNISWLSLFFFGILLDSINGSYLGITSILWLTSGVLVALFCEQWMRQGFWLIWISAAGVKLLTSFMEILILALIAFDKDYVLLLLQLNSQDMPNWFLSVVSTSIAFPFIYFGVKYSKILLQKRTELL